MPEEIYRISMAPVQYKAILCDILERKYRNVYVVVPAKDDVEPIAYGFADRCNGIVSYAKSSVEVILGNGDYRKCITFLPNHSAVSKHDAYPIYYFKPEARKEL